MQQTLRRVAKFLSVGALAAVFEYCIFALFVFLGLTVIFANVISFIVGFCISFTLNRTWVFLSKGSVKGQLIYYGCLAILNLLLGSTAIYYMVESLDVHPYIAKFVTMVLIAFWNYILFSKFIFRINKDQTNESERG